MDAAALGGFPPWAPPKAGLAPKVWASAVRGALQAALATDWGVRRSRTGAQRGDCRLPRSQASQLGHLSSEPGGLGVEPRAAQPNTLRTFQGVTLRVSTFETGARCLASGSDTGRVLGFASCLRASQTLVPTPLHTPYWPNSDPALHEARAGALTTGHVVSSLLAPKAKPCSSFRALRRYHLHQEASLDSRAQSNAALVGPGLAHASSEPRVRGLGPHSAAGSSRARAWSGGAVPRRAVTATSEDEVRHSDCSLTPHVSLHCYA